MRALKAVVLGEDGKKYIRACLQKGEGLCVALLRVSDHAEGNVFTVIPTDVQRDRAVQFTVGGLMRGIYSIEWLEGHLLDLTQSFPNGTLVFQDIWAFPEDGSGETPDETRFIVENEVYYSVPARLCDRVSLMRLIQAVTSFNIVGVFSKAPILKEWDSAFIENLASYAQEIFVGAYDQEGVVIWRRNGLPEML